LNTRIFKYINSSGVDEQTKQKVAIKKIWNVFTHDRDFQKRILREVKILKHFDHANVRSKLVFHQKHGTDNSFLLFEKQIISLVDLSPPRSKKEFSDVYIVSDLMETDLRQIIKSDQGLSDAHIQYFMYQIMCALNYIHSANVLHRDLVRIIIMKEKYNILTCFFVSFIAFCFSKPFRNQVTFF